MLTLPGVTLLLLLFFLPETRSDQPKSAANKQTGQETKDQGQSGQADAEQPAKSTGAKILDIVMWEPFRVISYLRFPPVLLTVYYGSFTFSSLYFLNISIQDSFSKAPYKFNSLIIGFLYLPAAIGYFVASVASGRWMDRIMAREARKAGRFDEDGQPIYHPEDRMRENAWTAAILYPVALIIYGWTVQYHTHWSIPVGLPIITRHELLTQPADRHLFLRAWLDGPVRSGHHHAYRVHARKELIRGCSRSIHSINSANRSS